MATFFSNAETSVPAIRIYREELSTQIIFIVKEKGWTLSSVIRASSAKRNGGESVKRKLSNIGHAQRYVISKRPTLGVKVKGYDYI